MTAGFINTKHNSPLKFKEDCFNNLSHTHIYKPSFSRNCSKNLSLLSFLYVVTSWIGSVKRELPNTFDFKQRRTSTKTDVALKKVATEVRTKFWWLVWSKFSGITLYCWNLEVAWKEFHLELAMLIPTSCDNYIKQAHVVIDDQNCRVQWIHALVKSINVKWTLVIIFRIWIQ